MNAASSRSFGIDTKNCLMRKVPYAVKMKGQTSDDSELFQLSCTTIWNSGIMRTTNGIMIEPR